MYTCCCLVDQVSDYRGKEYLLRAPNAEERGVWTHAIGAVIRALDSTAQVREAIFLCF